MRYFVTIGDRTVEVDLGGGRTAVDGHACDVELREVPGTTLRHLLLDGRSFPLVVRASESRGGWEIQLEGRWYSADVVDERTRAIREMTGRAGVQRGPRPVRAPMPGLVLRVQVAAGQTVRPGQGVVIVEAMKMENELKSDGGGIVSRVHVEPGQAVEKGAVLIEFEMADA